VAHGENDGGKNHRSPPRQDPPKTTNQDASVDDLFDQWKVQEMDKWSVDRNVAMY
jgi:hypothetical protein